MNDKGLIALMILTTKAGFIAAAMILLLVFGVVRDAFAGDLDDLCDGRLRNVYLGYEVNVDRMSAASLFPGKGRGKPGTRFTFASDEYPEATITGYERPYGYVMFAQDSSGKLMSASYAVVVPPEVASKDKAALAVTEMAFDIDSMECFHAEEPLVKETDHSFSAARTWVNSRYAFFFMTYTRDNDPSTLMVGVYALTENFDSAHDSMFEFLSEMME